jgi:hypothetical protein
MSKAWGQEYLIFSPKNKYGGPQKAFGSYLISLASKLRHADEHKKK